MGTVNLYLRKSGRKSNILIFQYLVFLHLAGPLTKSIIRKQVENSHTHKGKLQNKLPGGIFASHENSALQ